MRKSIILTLVFIMFVVPVLALGQPTLNATPNIAPDVIITRVIQFIWWIIITVAALLFIASAVLFLTSGGDSGKVETARNLLLYAIVGIIVGAAAIGISNFVITRIQTG